MILWHKYNLISIHTNLLTLEILMQWQTPTPIGVDGLSWCACEQQATMLCLHGNGVENVCVCVCARAPSVPLGIHGEEITRSLESLPIIGTFKLWLVTYVYQVLVILFKTCKTESWTINGFEDLVMRRKGVSHLVRYRRGTSEGVY